MSQQAAAAEQQQGADKPAAAKKEFIKSHAGLKSVPVKVMAMADLEVLDLCHNAIEVIPKGLFSDIPRLKTCDLSGNSIKALPDDIAELRELESLVLHHNSLSALPVALFSLKVLKTLDVAYNCITHLQHEIGDLEGLQVLELSGNRLRNLPCEIGWLGLKQLSVADNPNLHIPVHVLQQGLRAVMSYLSLVGEQHRQIESHMAVFTSRVTELRSKHNLLLPGAAEDESAVLLHVKLAQKLGVLSYSQCSLSALPAMLTAQDDTLAEVQVIDVSYNQLHSCPRDLLGCSNNLLVLNLSYNRLTRWPAGLNVPALVVLDLSFNDLVELPSDMGDQLPALEQLYLANNALTHLPDSLSLLELRDLFVSENDLKVVPQALSNCTALVKLSLAACQLSGPCGELAGMSQLRFLDISFNKLTELSDDLSSLDGLATLNVSYNKLVVFPDVISHMTCLRELNLDSTGIEVFPRGLGQLRQLEGLQAEGCPLVAPYVTLYSKNPTMLVALHDSERLAVDLSDCGLDAVPQDLLQQTQLTSLNLSKNNIQDLPYGLGNLQQLQQLGLKGNPLRQPYARLLDARGELAVLAMLRPDGQAGNLDLSACGFETLPSITWELPGRATSLLELQLTNNRLRTLPEELSTLVALSRLTLDNNLLRQLPDVVLKLPALAVVQASGNSITHLPDNLGQAHSLQALMLAGNQLHQLPATISPLSRLRALSVASNRLWQLPAGLCECSELKLLDCSHNLLARLPQGMSQLVNLRSLKLTHNRFGWLPVDDLQTIMRLEELHVAGNAFAVNGVYSLNATGHAAVQHLLGAIAASGSGVPPETPGGWAGQSGNAQAEDCSIAGASEGSCSKSLRGSASGVSVGRQSNSSIGGRSPSPLRGSQDASGSGLLSTLKRISSRSTSPFSRRQQPGSGVRWSDDAAAQGTASEATKTPVMEKRPDRSECAAGTSRSGVAAHPGQHALHSSISGSLGSESAAAAASAALTPPAPSGPSGAAGNDCTAGAAEATATVVAATACRQAAVDRPVVHFEVGDQDDRQAAKHHQAHVVAGATAQQPGAEGVGSSNAAVASHSAAPSGGDSSSSSSRGGVQVNTVAPASGEEQTGLVRDQPQHTSSPGDVGADRLSGGIAQQVQHEQTHNLAASCLEASGSGTPPAAPPTAPDSTSTAAPAVDKHIAQTQHGPATHADSPNRQPASKHVQQLKRPTNPKAPKQPARQRSPTAATSQAVQSAPEAQSAKQTVQPQPPRPEQPNRAAPGQLQDPSPHQVKSSQGVEAASNAVPSSGGITSEGVAGGSSGGSCQSPIQSSDGIGSVKTLHRFGVSGLPSGWDKVPVMDIPRVVKSLLQAPSPPAEAMAAGQPARPQTKARFRRVLQQGASALALLEYGMQQVGNQANKGTEGQ